MYDEKMLPKFDNMQIGRGVVLEGGVEIEKIERERYEEARPH